MVVCWTRRRRRGDNEDIDPICNCFSGCCICSISLVSVRHNRPSSVVFWALTGRVRGQNKNVELWKLFAGDNNTIMCREVVCAS